ncbi:MULTISPECIES: hypothetical protein [Xanthobacter]|uniref:hypothetical protein n=1 Tax=Xanthobacter TaxID=279 RepID=UPI00145E663C|nr:hypothetical protein [Xanthobacter sp. SG618]NMN59119.1 hypothetical protein [Xanthobacter sp. SG618]
MAGSGVGKTGGGSLFTVVSATTLVATEAFATAIAAGWALAGLMHLGDIGEYALMGLFSLAALYITVKYFRRAYQVEMSLD